VCCDGCRRLVPRKRGATAAAAPGLCCRDQLSRLSTSLIRSCTTFIVIHWSKQANSSLYTSEVAPSPAPAVGRGKLLVECLFTFRKSFPALVTQKQPSQRKKLLNPEIPTMQPVYPTSDHVGTCTEWLARIERFGQLFRGGIQRLQVRVLPGSLSAQRPRGSMDRALDFGAEYIFAPRNLISGH
jgi:hypothetical protein